MNIQLVPVKLHEDSRYRFNSVENDLSNYSYTGILIADGGQYYYWAKGISFGITEGEYRNVKLNPRLYYFSTALKLHIRIDKLRGAYEQSI